MPAGATFVWRGRRRSTARPGLPPGPHRRVGEHTHRSISVSAALYDALRATAAARGTSMAALVERALGRRFTSSART